LPPAAVGDNLDAMRRIARETARHGHSLDTAQWIVQDQVGVPTFVAQQAVRGRAVYREIEHAPVVATTHGQIEGCAPKLELDDGVPLRLVGPARRVGPGWGKAPRAHIARLARVGHVLPDVQRSDFGRVLSQGRVQGTRLPCRIAQRKSPARLCGCLGRLPRLEDHRPHPGPLAAGERDRVKGVAHLALLVHDGPRAGRLFQAGQRGAPAPRGGPHRHVPQPHAHHLPPHPGRPGKVEPVAPSRRVGRIGKTVGLEGDRVEKVSSARVDHPAQEIDLVEVERPCLNGRGKCSEQDDRPRVGLLHADRAFAQQRGVGGGIDVLPTPVRAQVGFVPDLVGGYSPSIAPCHGGGERAPVGDFLGGGGRACALAIRRGPGRRTVQHGDEVQVARGTGLNDPIPRRPVKRSPLRFDALPGKALAHPAETRCLDLGQSAIECGGVILIQVGVDAQVVEVSQGIGEGEHGPLRPGSFRVPCPPCERSTEETETHSKPETQRRAARIDESAQGTHGAILSSSPGWIGHRR